MSLALVPGRTYEIPVTAIAGERISITTSSRDFTDDERRAARLRVHQRLNLFELLTFEFFPLSE
jgi:hypothetical protein